MMRMLWAMLMETRDDKWLAKLGAIVRESGFINVPFSKLETTMSMIFRLNDDDSLRAYISMLRDQTNQPAMSDDVAKLMGLPNPRHYRNYVQVSLCTYTGPWYNRMESTVLQRNFENLREAYDFLIKLGNGE